MENPLITIIVPVYNVEQYLRTCIESVINQSYTNWELLLVNDGSIDKSPDICNEYAIIDERIDVIHKVNGGLSSARNSGLDNASGDYVTFLDSDDFWHPDYLNTMVGLCLIYDADISQCNFIRGKQTEYTIRGSRFYEKTFDKYSIFLNGYSKIIMWAKLYKIHLFEGIRMPVGTINEDDFTTWKLYFNAKRIVVTNKPLYYYTYNENSIMSRQLKKPKLHFIEAYKERIDFFKNLGEKELEEHSHAHFCKALLLSYQNPALSLEQEKKINELFRLHWNWIKWSGNVPKYLKVLFLMFRFLPKTTLGLLKVIR